MNIRLNAYHICYNDGFYIHKALLLKDKYTTMDKKLTITKTREVEKYIHDELLHINTTTSTRRLSEWFACSKNGQEIDRVLHTAHTKFIDDTDPPIIGFVDPLYDRFIIDDIEEIKTELKITDKIPSYLPQPRIQIKKPNRPPDKILDSHDQFKNNSEYGRGKRTIKPKVFKDHLYFE